jgi:RNA polymerase sigma-70 factor, ECF subfamily
VCLPPRSAAHSGQNGASLPVNEESRRNIARNPDISHQMMASGGGREEKPDPQRSKFDACFEAHYSQVLAFAIRRVGGRASAEDVLAETFAIAWRRKDVIPDAALPWLYGIAGRVVANHRRSTRRRLRLGRRLWREPAKSGRDPAEVVGERDAAVAAFSKLSGAQREILMLVAWEGLDASDGSIVLGCTPAAFRVRLHRARRALAKHLDAAGHLPRERLPAPPPNCKAAEETK